jgi:hypothetical protein
MSCVTQEAALEVLVETLCKRAMEERRQSNRSRSVPSLLAAQHSHSLHPLSPAVSLLCRLSLAARARVLLLCLVSSTGTLLSGGLGYFFLALGPRLVAFGTRLDSNEG